MGYSAHIDKVDALVMGRNTLELVLSLECDWPYAKPVFILSNTMTETPKGYEDKVFLIKGDLKEIIDD